MKSRRVQFSIRRALAATFWVAIYCGATLANRGIGRDWDVRSSDWLWFCVRVITFYTGIISPFIAVGVLFARATPGGIVGFAVASIVIAGSALANMQQGAMSERGHWSYWIAWGVLGLLVAIWALFRRHRTSPSNSSGSLEML